MHSLFRFDTGRKMQNRKCLSNISAVLFTVTHSDPLLKEEYERNQNNLVLFRFVYVHYTQYISLFYNLAAGPKSDPNPTELFIMECFLLNSKRKPVSVFSTNEMF